MNSICESDSQPFLIEYFHQVGLLLKTINTGYIVIVPMEYGLLCVVNLDNLMYY